MLKCTRVLAGLALLVAGLATPALAGDTAELVRQLEALRQVVADQQKQIEALSAKVEELEQRPGPQPAKSQQAALAARVEALSDVVSSAFEETGKRTEVNLYGTAEYQNFTRGRPSFDAKDIELLATSEPYKELRIGSEIDFEGTAQTSEGPRQGDVEVEQAWVELGFAPAVALRGGVVLVPFGHYNLYHFEPLRELLDRPILAQRIIPTTWAEAGVGLTGTRGLPAGLAVKYEAYLLNGLTDRLTDTSTRAGRGAFRSDNNSNKAVAARLQFTAPAGHRLGLSGYYGKYDRSGHAIAGGDLDWSFLFGPAELYGEYAYFGLEKGMNDLGFRTPGMMQGLYAGAHYRFWPELLRSSWLGKRWPDSLLAATVRWGFGQIEDDGDEGEGDNLERRLSLGLNYRPVPALALKLEYQINTTRKEDLEHGDADGFLAGMSAAF